MLVSAGDFLDDVCVGNRSVHLVVYGSTTFCGQPMSPENRLPIVDLLRDVPRGGLATRFRRHGCVACMVVVSGQIRAQVKP